MENHDSSHVLASSRSMAKTLHAVFFVSHPLYSKASRGRFRPLAPSAKRGHARGSRTADADAWRRRDSLPRHAKTDAFGCTIPSRGGRIPGFPRLPGRVICAPRGYCAGLKASPTQPRACGGLFGFAEFFAAFRVEKYKKICLLPIDLLSPKWL